MTGIPAPGRSARVWVRCCPDRATPPRTAPSPLQPAPLLLSSSTSSAMPAPTSASSEATPPAAYVLPIFFAVSMGVILLREIMAEPMGIKLAGSSIDTGSRVISMLAPTVIKGVLYAAVVVGILFFVAASYTKSGAAFLKSLSGSIARSGGKGGRRLD